jgi:mannose-6-phosphate isomerase-like protein (cupin superfamily)
MCPSSSPAIRKALCHSHRKGQKELIASLVLARVTIPRKERMKIRRVVTGHTPDGKATVASDTEIDPITIALAPETEFNILWGADAAPTFPDDGSPHSFLNYFPPVGGFRFVLFTLPRESVLPSEQLDMRAALKEVEEKLPGLIAHMERDNPGMHTTDTIDFEYIISGEVWLELDDGEEVHLRAGDTVVQNGTRHAWRNKGSEPCRMAICLIGAHRR